MRQKKRNQEFYKDIRQRRERLQIDARQEYDEARKVYLLQLKDAKEEVVSTHEAKVAKKQKIKNIKHKLKSAKYSYQHNMFMAKNYHPAWSTDPDIKSMFTQVHSMKMNKLELEKQFDDRIDTLKESFRSRIDGIQSVPQAKKDRIINWTFFTTWYNHAGFKILSMIAMCLIVFFSILGLFDSIPETSFLLHHAYVGSISVFIFVALIILAIWIGFKVASLVRRRAGVYDIVEAKYSKEESVSNTIGLTSKPSDEFNYLEELFTKEEKE